MTLQRDRQQVYALTRREVVLQLEGTALDEAQRYCDDGAVVEPSTEDASLYAMVRRRGETYAVEVSVADGEVYVDCTCNYAGAGVCAHAGAVLLTWVDSPDLFDGYDASHAPSSTDRPRTGPDYVAEYREVLAQQTVKELRELARQRDVDITGTRKDPMIEELAVRLGNLEAAREGVNALPRSTQDLLIYLNLILGPGYGLSGEHIVTALHSKQASLPRRSIHEQLVELSHRALLLTFKRDGRVYYTLPQAVRASLPPRPGFVPLYSEKESGALNVRERAATSTIRSLHALWAYIVERSPRHESSPARLPIEDRWPQFEGWDHLPEEIDDIVQRKRTPYNLYNVSVTVPTPRHHLRDIDRSLLRAQGVMSDEEGEFNYALLEGLGVVDGSDGERIVHQPQTFENYLSLSPTAQMYSILSAWSNTTAWSEMDLLRRRDESICIRRNLMYTSFKPSDLYREWRAGRQTVLRFLSTIEQDRWVSLEGLLRVMHEITPGLLHSQSDSAVWWIVSRRTGKQFGTTFEDWQESSGRFVTAVLEGPLHWFGAVSLGYRDDKLVALKVTPVGSFALQRRAALAELTDAEAPEGAVQLRDDLTVVVVPGHTPPQLHDLLHFVGHLEEASPDCFVYRITAEGVLLALEEGQTIDRLLNLIRHWSGQDIPPAWQERMDVWSENYGKLHVYDDITLIELADDYALQELLSNTSLRDHLVYEFSPRLIAIRPTAIDSLVEEMEKRGYTPHVE